MDELVIREDRDGAATLILNRPDKLNALNVDLFRALDAQVERLERETESTGLVIVRGAGKAGEKVWGTGGDIGFTRDGSHAEFILLPAAAVTPKPPALSMEAAGSAGVTFVTAWSAMITAANISSGETAVIIGAAGGVGSAAVQIAKSRGAKVIAVVRSDDDATTSRQNGAESATATGLSLPASNALTRMK